MSLLTDCLAAGGTLGIAIGSGLQAGSELRRYGATARLLGLTEAAESVIELWQASMRFYSMLQLPFSLWPGFSWSIWRLKTNTQRYRNAIKRYNTAFRAIGSAQVTEKLTEADKVLARELALKSGYWFLIMIGTCVVFAGSIVGIVLDLR